MVAAVLVSAVVVVLVAGTLGTGGGRATVGSSVGAAGSQAATQSAGLACSDFGALERSLQEGSITIEQIQAELDQVAAQASAAAATDPGAWTRLSDDASALDLAVAGNSEASGADASALAQDCQVIGTVG